jgi:hypothetical protein
MVDEGAPRHRLIEVRFQKSTRWDFEARLALGNHRQFRGIPGRRPSSSSGISPAAAIKNFFSAITVFVCVFALN